MSSHIPADPIYYKASLWGARESFVYSFKSLLVSVKLGIDFTKLDSASGKLVANAEIRVPLSKSIQFLGETEFKDVELCAISNRFETYLEKDVRKRSEKRTTFEGAKFCSYKDETRISDNEMSSESSKIINPLLLFLGLRTLMNQSAKAPTATLVATSGRLYSVNVQVERDDALLITDEESRSLRVLWDKNLGVPKQASLNVPVFGAINLRLESAKKMP